MFWLPEFGDDTKTRSPKFTKTLCLFGWIVDGKIHLKVIGTSKKLPYLYIVNKKPYVKPFSDILKTNQTILMVTIDQKTARIQKFIGSQIIQESKLKIDFLRDNFNSFSTTASEFNYPTTEFQINLRYKLN